MIATPDKAELEYLITGRGWPVTVFAGGFGCSIADSRPLASAVAGSRVFFHPRGHGRSWAPPGEWDYGDLGRDLGTIADFTGASRAVGASLGAGALCELLTRTPDRFERLVFFLPAVLDMPGTPVARAHLSDLLGAVDAGETARTAEIISREIPSTTGASVEVWDYLRQRLNFLMRNGLSQDLARIIGQPAVADCRPLREVQSPALVIACQGDELHPVAVAERLCEVLPHAVLQVYDQPGILWGYRAELRERVSSFLNVDGGT